MTKINKKNDDYKPSTEKDKLAFLVLSIWGLCIPLLFITINRNLYKNALSGSMLWIHWTLLVVVIALWHFVWKKSQVIQPLLLSSLCGLIVFTAVFMISKPNLTYFDAFVMIQKQHPEISVQAYVTEDELKSDAAKVLYYVKPAKKAYNLFLKMDYIIYGIHLDTKEDLEFRVSPK